MIVEKTFASLSISLDLYSKGIMIKERLAGLWGCSGILLERLMKGKEQRVAGDSGLLLLRKQALVLCSVLFSGLHCDESPFQRRPAIELGDHHSPFLSLTSTFQIKRQMWVVDVTPWTRETDLGRKLRCELYSGQTVSPPKSMPIQQLRMGPNLEIRSLRM